MNVMFFPQCHLFECGAIIHYDKCTFIFERLYYLQNAFTCIILFNPHSAAKWILLSPNLDKIGDLSKVHSEQRAGLESKFCHI